MGTVYHGGPLAKITMYDTVVLLMPNLQNAKKALRVSARKRVMNDKRRKAIKDTVKGVKALVGAEKKIIAANLAKAYQAIDKAAKRGIIKMNAASRKKSRLAKALKPKK